MVLKRYFHSAEDDDAGDANEHLTAYRCRRGLVRQNGTAFKTALCLRGYRRLPGLYDALLKVAVLGGRTHGGESDLTLSGVTVETVERVVTQYLGVIAWTTSPS